jgi:DNA (cytosine-5)-methyltransferase 1
MRILNLYAGIGGNRKLWDSGHEITAVEINPDIAAIYKDLFPLDNLVVGDAHQYLLDHFAEFDFIWSSPPCQSHSSFRQNICVRYRGTRPEYPDMKLYQEILFLQHNYKNMWVVENVKPYYDPLIKPDRILQRHFFWSNFFIEDTHFETDNIRKAQIPDFEKKYGYDLSRYKIENKRQILRNCVAPELGQHILNCGMQYKKKQTTLFDMIGEQ